MTLPEDHLLQQRLSKREALQALGASPYPSKYERTHTATQALADFESLQGQTISLAGRIVGGLRGLGKTTFFHIVDASGQLQINLRLDILGEEKYGSFKFFDSGDWIGVRGTLFRTQRGEITLLASDFTMLSKALLPLPEKWHGLTEVEKRYRQRYLDLIVNSDARLVFARRSAIVAAVRRFLERDGFVEVETPVLQPIYGGAAAKPFETYHNALDRRLFLRIATELYLKRLIVGGMERIFEIGKVFRNEGISVKHNPEYTLLEAYQALADYRDVMSLVENMVSFVANEVLGTQTVGHQGQTIDVTPPWPRLPLREAILQHSGVDYDAYPDRESLYRKMIQMGLRVDATMGRGKLIDELLTTFVEPRLIQPVFLTDYPVEMSPLAKRHADAPNVAERFEAFMGGIEIANAFSELNDPVDQRARFEEQVAQRAAGDEEAHVMDVDFLVALEHGMPPTGGLGVGIDRLVMLLTDQQSIRDVILFPQLRTKD